MLRFTKNIIAQMTPSCNLQCRYCYEGNHEKLDLEKKNYIDFETFKRYLDTAIYYRCILGNRYNPIDWHFHGGEVLLVPFEELKKEIEYLEERKKYFPNLTWCIQTNGTLLNDEIADYFKGKFVGFSFDGVDVTDRMSKLANEALIEKIKKYSEVGVKFGYLTVLSRANLTSWIDTYNLLKDYTESFSINPISSTNKEEELTADELWEYWYLPVLNSYLTNEPIREGTVSVVIRKAITDIVFNYEKNLKVGCYDRICAHGSNMITLDYKGNLSPCDKYLSNGQYFSQRKVKNVIERDFLGLQSVKYVFDYHKKMFEEEKRLGCNKCCAKNVCQGDCQACSLSNYGEFRLNENLCSLYKRAYDFISENWIEILKLNSIYINNKARFINTEALKKAEEAGFEIVYKDKSVHLRRKR